MHGQLNTILPLRISVNDLVLKAVGAAYSRVPEANIANTEQAMRHFDSVDVAIAVDSERGLVTPSCERWTACR